MYNRDIVDKEVFTKMLIAKIESLVPNKFSLSYDEYYKANNSYNSPTPSLCVGLMDFDDDGRYKGRQNIRIGDLYEAYITGDRYLEDIAHEVISIINNADASNNEAQKFFMELNRGDLNEVKDSIFLRCLDYDKNKDFLDKNNVPYRTLYSDKNTTVVSICYIGKGSGKSQMTCNVNDSILDNFGIGFDEMYDIAEENVAKDIYALDIMEFTELAYQRMKQELSYDIYDMSFEELDSYKIDIDEDEDMDICDGMARSMNIVSNHCKVNGSSILASKPALERLSNKFGDSIILPSSKHELLVLPLKRNINHNTDIDVLLDMVKTVNCNEVNEEDILTDGIFLLKDNKVEFIAS